MLIHDFSYLTRNPLKKILWNPAGMKGNISLVTRTFRSIFFHNSRRIRRIQQAKIYKNYSETWPTIEPRSLCYLSDTLTIKLECFLCLFEVKTVDPKKLSLTVSNEKCKCLHWQKRGSNYSGVKSTKMWTRGSNPMFWSKLHITSSRLRKIPLACTPHGPKISQISAVFWKIWQNCMLVPPRGLVPPPMGNPGSVPDWPKYLDQFLMVLLVFVWWWKQGVGTLYNQNH